MSARWARTSLAAYRMLGAGLYPFMGAVIRMRARKGKEDRARRRERYGVASIERPAGPLIWAHAVSVGETAAIAPLLESLAGDGLNIVLTTGTVTSAKLAADRLGQVLIHQYVPMDLKPAVSRFLTHWKPDLALIAESEIWPMTILELGARRIPQVLVNGRLSDRSFESWSRRLSLAEALLENLSHVVAQSELDAARFEALGARPVSVSGNLKADSPPPPDKPEERRILTSALGQRPVWAAISTHNGEEIIAANVHMALRTRMPGLVTFIVPRHPDRAADIIDMLSGKGLVAAQRSLGQPITPDTDIYLCDTIGDMGLILRLVEVAFVGNSMTGAGGQNPLEPAMLGAAVLSGRNVQNFRDSYKALVENGGARIVDDPRALARAVATLLTDADKRQNMISAAEGTVVALQGSLERTRAILEPYVRPLILKANLEAAGKARTRG
ncbi:MAG: lipid IV(A) 3-deoxy-D-manno-octulosonic acid transferase [Rhizobiaceae bacterium]|jgi:3-deoxy-D-manno-octulosonic-acid transferase|nr:lipid IV(A) 3-deoxy-D-manno-octulosonic acid transferase [Rhizobiaceae bacterium]